MAEKKSSLTAPPQAFGGSRAVQSPWRRQRRLERQKRFGKVAEKAEKRMTATHENLSGKGEKLRPWGENGKKLRDAQQKS